MDPATPRASRDYRLLLLGQTTSQLGTQVSAVVAAAPHPDRQ